MFFYIYCIAVAGIAKKLQVANSYEVRWYTPFHHSTNQAVSPPPAAAKLGKMPVRSGTLHISLSSSKRYFVNFYGTMFLATHDTLEESKFNIIK
jgi:hypothetical protein